MEAAGDGAAAARAGVAGNGVPSRPQQGAKRGRGGGVRGTEAELADCQVPAGGGVADLPRAGEWRQGAKDPRSHTVLRGSATSTHCDLATP
ncbi:unnamed protein product [Urochloa humidicola]